MKKHNSRRTTNKTKFLAGIDGRTTAARRIKDLHRQLEELAIPDGQQPTVGEEALLRQLSTLLAHQEIESGKLANGAPFDNKAFISVTNTTVRLLRELGILKAFYGGDGEDDGAPEGESLEDYVARTYGDHRGLGSRRSAARKKDRRRERLGKNL